MTTEHTVQEAPRTGGQGRLDAYFWGGVLIWAGVVFYADSVGFLPTLADGQAWAWIFLGAGIYGFLLDLVCLASSRLAPPTTWDYVWAGIFLLIGLGGLTSFNIVWPLILVLVGIVVIATNLLQRT